MRSAFIEEMLSMLRPDLSPQDIVAILHEAESNPTFEVTFFSRLKTAVRDLLDDYAPQTMDSMRGRYVEGVFIGNRSDGTKTKQIPVRLNADEAILRYAGDDKSKGSCLTVSLFDEMPTLESGIFQLGNLHLKIDVNRSKTLLSIDPSETNRIPNEIWKQSSTTLADIPSR